MAKNIFTTLEDRILDVDHKAFGTKTFELPSWFPTDAVFEEEDNLMAWCREEGILLATLQAGMQKHLIDTRAKARPSSLKGVDQDWDGKETARVGEFVPTPMKRPGTGGGGKAVSQARAETIAKAREAMLLAGIPQAQVDVIIATM